MRITSQMMVQQAIGHMNQNLETIQTLQEKIASGKQVINLSDDPSTAATALNLRSTIHTIDSYLSAANTANDWMSTTEQSLKQVMDVATRATDLAKSGVSDTSGATERLSLSSEMDALLVQALELANSAHQEKFIFGGFQIRPGNPPFTGVDADADGQFESVTYNGDAGVILQEVGPSQNITTNIQGPATFTRLFNAIIEARDALYTNNVPNLQTAITDLNTATDDVNTSRTTNGARQRQLKNTLSRIETAKNDVKNLLSKKEDTNVAEAISLLTYQETVYQSTLEVGKRAIAATTLFDYIK